MNEEKKEEGLKNKTEESNLNIASSTIKTSDIKLEEKKKENSKKRQVILETDGNSIQIIKAEVAGTIELIAILGMMLEALKSKQNF